MNQENKISINNLMYALLFLVFGIMLLTTTESIISIVSKVIGGVLILIGAIKSIYYIYMKGKVGDYSIFQLIIGLILISCGLLLVLVSSTLGFAIRIIMGLWVLFAGINRIIFSISTLSIDKKGFLVYLVTAFVMLILGVLLISGIFDKAVGALIVIYSITEIVDYIYFKVKFKNYGEQKNDIIPVKKEKKFKKGKVVDAVIEDE